VNKRQIKILDERINRDFLPFVRRPSRYIGGEINQKKKDLAGCDVTAALCFPDVYEIGMSNTGLAIIYDVLNTLDGVAAERVFAPWADAEKILRENKIPLFTLESKAELKSFDILGFSLTSELCYTNVLNMLDLACLELRSKDRSEDAPLVIAGGTMANCCEPVAEFFDMFVIGEGEDAVVELVNLLKACKKAGMTKKDFLIEAARKFEWAYVPCLYNFEYEQGKIKNFSPAVSGLPKRLKNAVVRDFENAPVPTAPIVPFTQAVHERVSVEIMRGCPGRCLFCQASFCRRPVRMRSVKKIFETAKACYQATGFDTVSLLSLSTADYPKLEKLIEKLNDYFSDKFVGLSVPSLRVDKQLKFVPGRFASIRKAGLTIAVEAAGERLRQIINKPLKEKDLFSAVEAAYRAGWRKLKLYFMVGLPGETQQDIEKIVDLSVELAQLCKKVNGRPAQINITVSWLVPKPHTPLGRLGQKPLKYFENAKKLILGEKRKRRVNFLHFKFHSIRQSILESAIGRADRRLADVIEQAWREGARFDLWDECFDFELWQAAFEKFGLNLETEAAKEFATEQILPWEHLGGPEKKHLLKHLAQAMKMKDSV